MQKKALNESYKIFLERMTEKNLLKRLKMSKKSMLALLAMDDWKNNLAVLLAADSFSCADVLQISNKTLSRISPEPEEGWLENIYNHIIGLLFPHRASQEPKNTEADYEAGGVFLLHIIRTVYKLRKGDKHFDLDRDIRVLKNEEISGLGAEAEYLKLKAMLRNYYLHEFMLIGTEVTTFNTLGHIAGVHYVAMHVAKQLASANAPVDIALVSGAAISHDLGKYGCKPEEATRTPYLHYYYTDQCMRSFGMPVIAHIAANHSTWDLELENLSVESLILIYADFRVKSSRNTQGKEITYFYTLKEAFQVILDKLDNVDDAKRERYTKVYSKLKDFEEYMESLGVNTELDSEKLEKPQKKDPALLNPDEVIDTLKHLAIEHNINLMSKFNNETSFGNLVEAARSEKQWKNIRAYVSIFQEYSTYMTQKQKQMVLHFLYELLMHREGDIRRQAAYVMGELIAGYDEEYRKELPAGALIQNDDMTGLELWDLYLKEIIFPDYKITDQHRRWIGYSLRSVFKSILGQCKNAEIKKYIETLLKYYDDAEINDASAFVLLDSMLFIPFEICNTESKLKALEFAAGVSARKVTEIKISALRCAKYVVESDNSPALVRLAERIIKNSRGMNGISAVYLKYKILKASGNQALESDKCSGMLYSKENGISDIFLENLKTDTPWVIKSVNIELLLDRLEQGMEEELLHITTHLSNLLKVSERVTVRHSAGKALLSVIKRLPLDQRNEVVIELTRGLEIGEYQFSKYIPEYLGELGLFLHPNELDELINELEKQTESTNDRISSVALDTVGVVVRKYSDYKTRFIEKDKTYDERLERLLGILLRGLGNYHQVVWQEAFEVIGQHIFGAKELPLDEKCKIFKLIYKKMLTLLVDQQESELAFFNNSASLNNIYRFIKDYTFAYGAFAIETMKKAAFFPGTFDPFSLSHKGIVQEIRKHGFEVYLALDEFSWSKKTQPRMVRRKIITMSVANEGHVFVFPDSIPINLSNERDLNRLRELLDYKELYVVVGSDVVANASSYKAPPTESSIHHFNHVVFQRETAAEGACPIDGLNAACKNIKGKVLELKLPLYLEDISSTRIRENIDLNRDISNLIDPIAQNYIYDNSLYLREPQYKLIMQTKDISIEEDTGANKALVKEIEESVLHNDPASNKFRDYMNRISTSIVIIRDGRQGNAISALCAYNKIDTKDLYAEFKDLGTATYIREHASGKIAVIGGLVFSETSEIQDLPQLILTEALSACLRDEFTYAVFHKRQTGEIQRKTVEVLERQGFFKIPSRDGTDIYTVDMKFPLALLQNMETTIKDPLNSNERVLKALEAAYKNLQRALTRLYPGNLVISYNAGVMHHKLVKMITAENQVPCEQKEVRELGPYMCVPFGKILRGKAVPNTVTKTLHTDKIFDPEIKTSVIGPYPYYSPLLNQIRTIKSFDRGVILVDDILHKGYRIKELNPMLESEDIYVRKIIVGILSGQGKDLMTIQKRRVGSPYFIPNMKAWFVESSMYPFIGGDSVRRNPVENASVIPSINLILPYVAPGFLQGAPREAIYDFSMTCLQNAANILKVLEEEYQESFQKTLTLNRLSEAVIFPRSPDNGECMQYDLNVAPSVYVLNDIEKLKRLRGSIIGG